METGMQQPYGRFDALIARHRQLIHNMCMRRADGNVGRCAELVQDCYIALWHYLPSLREEASHLQEAAWVAWQCRSVFSRRGKASPSLLPIDDYMAGPLVPDDDDPLRERIDAMAKVLTPHERHALELMAEGYSLGEMARELGIRRGSAAKLRHRIYEKLRRHFNPEFKNQVKKDRRFKKQ
ncbi:MAG: sigma-70 family RNA polymerase sigma factor [Bacteroidales bacterium]|nr:sigma-70 family RNA polymerase sigma factor [Bacteroidales bacterium]